MSFSQSSVVIPIAQSSLPAADVSDTLPPKGRCRGYLCGHAIQIVPALGMAGGGGIAIYGGVLSNSILIALGAAVAVTCGISCAAIGYFRPRQKIENSFSVANHTGENLTRLHASVEQTAVRVEMTAQGVLVCAQQGHEVVEQLKKELQEKEHALQGLAEQLQKTTEELNTLREHFRNMKQSIQELKQLLPSLSKANQQLKSQSSSLSDGADQIERASSKLVEEGKEFQRIAQEYAQVADLTRNLSKEMDQFLQAHQQLASEQQSIGQQVSHLKELNKQVAELNVVLEKQMEEYHRLGQKIEQQQETLQLIKEFGQFKELLPRLREHLPQIRRLLDPSSL